MKTPESRLRARFALTLGLAQWGLLVGLQVASAMTVLRQLPVSEGGLLALWAKLPFLQAENALVAASISLLAFVAAPIRRGRFSLLFAAAVLGFYAVFDQVGYKLFFDRVSIGLFSQAGWGATDSLLKELDSGFLVASTTWCVICGLLFRHWLAADLPRQARPGRGLLIAGAMALGIAGLSIWRPAQHFNLERHAAIALLQQWWADSRIPAVRAESAAEDISSLRFGQPASAPADLAALIDFPKATGQRPNVVLVVLESVGSHQLLPGGNFDRKVTPTLSKLGERGTLFDSIYVPYAGTIPSNVALQTGGLVSTWTAPSELFHLPYRGPTLATMFRDAGYRTALFAAADLRYQGLERFLSQSGYDVLQSYGKLEQPHSVAALNSWGGRDDQMLPLLADWLSGAAPGKAPFFLHFMSNAPHHPYNTPPGISRMEFGAGEQGDYRNALHYIDGVIAGLLSLLERQGAAENTVLIVTGDHGEAFGVLHPTRRTHLGLLQDEAVRSFFLFSPLGQSGSNALRISRPGSNGDLLPTLAALAKAPTPASNGQNLFGPAYRDRIQYFHGENKRPRYWGLRDGEWKYLIESGGRAARLFNLDLDPLEQNDVAALHPEKTELYERLCALWYTRQDAQFISRFRAENPLPAVPQDLLQPGFKAAEVGYRYEEGGYLSFRPADRFNPQTPPVYRTRWLTGQQALPVKIVWQGPDRSQAAGKAELGPNVSELDSSYPGPLPLKAGRWKVRLLTANSGAFLDERSFEIDARAPLQPPVSRLRTLVMVEPGKLGFSRPKAVFGAGEVLGIETKWLPVDRSEAFQYVLTAPSGEQITVPFEVPAQQEFRQSSLRPPAELMPGAWQLAVHGPAGVIGRARFSVAPERRR